MKKRKVWSEAKRKTFTDLVEKWRGFLLLNGHHIGIVFSEEDDKTEEGSDDVGASARCHTNTPYMSGHAITFYPSMLNDDEDIERKVIHELMHIITRPSKEIPTRLIRDKFVTWREICDTNETLTDWIANIVWAMHDGQPKR